MRSLFDINVLIALFDANHVHHQRAQAWWAVHAAEGWASCPLTENGVVRIMAGPPYRARLGLGPSQILSLLETFALGTDHVFWPDGQSLRDASVFERDRVLTASMITNTYLLALASSHGGRLVTFDQRMSPEAARAATPDNLVRL